jgi:hypothetical protein
MILPPVIFVFGTTFNQEVKLFTLFHFFVSIPISEINSTADVSMIEGILHKSTPVSDLSSGSKGIVN